MNRTHTDATPPQTVEEKLDVIIMHLDRIDRRDRMRMWGGYLHSVFTLIPLIFFIWSTWYIYAHFNDIMGAMMQQAARSAAESTGQGYEDFLKQLQETFGR